MRKFIPGNFTILLSGLILFLSSCTPESCLEETNAFVKASFYLSKTNKSTTPDSLTLYGINIDSSKIYNKSLRVQRALIPLNTITGKCKFIIIINGITDTLNFIYSSYPHLVSKECGYTFYHNLVSDSLTFTTNIIDSIDIRKSSITTINEENLRIFY